MRNVGQLYRELEAIDVDEFESKSMAVADQLTANGGDLDAVEQIVTFMEDHPSIDFGPPGPLSHFVETFHRKGYDEIIVASVARQLTEHTLWLLHRLMNGESPGAKRDRLKAIHAAGEMRLA